MTSQHVDDPWGAPFLEAPAPPPPPPAPTLVAARVASTDEDATEPPPPPPPPPSNNDVVDALERLRKDAQRQTYAVLLILAVQGFLLFTYLERPRSNRDA